MKRTTALAALVALVSCTAVVYAASRLLPGSTGLKALYYDGPEWQNPNAAAKYIDSPPSTALLKERRPDFAARPFSVEWRGFLAVPRGGVYTLRTISDDGSWVYVRGQEVVSNGGRHGAAEAHGTIPLDAGVHSIFIRYFQDGDDCAFELSWSRDGAAFEPVPRWALLTDRVGRARVIAGRASTIAVTTLGVIWYAVAAAALLVLVAKAATHVVRFRPEGLGLSLGSVLALSFVLNVWGITWGMPNRRGWAPDEIVPPDVLDALQAWFSHGWHDKYPPFHYIVLAAADSPVLVLSWLGVVDLNAAGSYAALALIGRSVSLVFAAATLVMMYRCGLLLYGHRGALFAALTTALTVPFAYYSKLANLDVPYLFWFTVSLFAYVRILQHHARRDYVLFAFSAALAGCTKDQAWGLYFLTPIAILIARWRASRETGASCLRALVDGTTMRAAAAGFATFVLADNLLFNFGGFVAHVRLLLGTPAAFQHFPRTVAGEIQMAWHAVQEMQLMFGWPLAIVAALALARGIAGRTTKPPLGWLFVPALSYYAAFVAVILFYFDRYLLPVTFVLSLYVGFWLDRFLEPGVRARRARIALVSAAFAYSVLYVMSVDYAMASDSRYAVTEYVRGHSRPDDVTGSLGPLEYQAIADALPWQSVESVEDVAAARPRFIVLNAEQMPFLAPKIRAMHESLLDGRAGYRLAFRYRAAPMPLPGIHPDIGGASRHGPELSDLGMINPTMEVFEKEGR